MPGKKPESLDESSQPASPVPDVSRRSFLKGVGLGTAGLTAINVSLPKAEASEPSKAPPLIGPDPVAIELKVNGQTYPIHVELSLIHI